MSTLKPLKGRPLTFWFCAGDIIWIGDERPTPIDAAQVEPLRELYSDEARAATAARDPAAASHAARLWAELANAMTALDMWRRATTTRRAA